MRKTRKFASTLLAALWVCWFSADARGDWKTDWEQTVRAAENEGQVTVYIGGYSAVVDAGVFQKAYPKIKIVSVTGSGTDLTARISTERRAGKYIPDVYGGGGNSLYQVLYLGKMVDPIKPTLMVPEVTDPSKWWEGKHKYLDKEGQYVLVYEANLSDGGGATYNTQLLKPQEFKSYWDFATPKLKGKVLSIDVRRVRGAGIPWQFLYYNPDLGPKFIRRLFAETEPVMTADLRQAVDWLATGKFALCIPTQGSGVYQAQKQGLPVNGFDPYHFKEGVNLSSAFGSLALMNRAPHPNAAKVFINWYLSREGQTLFQKTMSLPGESKNSRRIDVPKDHVPPEERLRDNLKYFDTDDPETKDLTPVIKLLDEIIAAKK